MRLAAMAALLVPVVLAWAGNASAAWNRPGGGSGFGKARTMPTGSTPAGSVSNRNVTVSWSQSSFSGGPAVSGYAVRRYDTGGNSRTVGSGCSGTISALSCTEQAVPAGAWKYSVTPTQSAWTGAESAQSASVTVASPTLTFTSSTTVTSLPASLNGNLSNFISGQTVTFKLDDPSSGTTLSGTVSPSPVPSSGSASVTVTIPTGTTNGSHTVYAVGSQGDTASAGITVAVPSSITTSAWDLRDASSGTETNQSDYWAAAGDNRYLSSLGAFPASFDTTKYLDFDYSSVLPAGRAVSGAQFNFNFLGVNSSLAATKACFYLEVRRISTGAVLGTHGSAGNPVACTTSLTFLGTTTSLPEVSTSDIANDLRVRVYMTNAATYVNYVDLATVSGSMNSMALTLYEKKYADATFLVSGNPYTIPWSLAASGDSGSGGGAYYTTANDWNTTFSTSKYLKLTFPAYVPSGSTAISATFHHSYRSDNGGTSCWYFEVYNATTLIGTHGSSSSPVSCNSSTSTWVTDNVAINEVDTVAKANNLVVKMYLYNNNSAGGNNKKKTQHDLATVTITYTN